MELCSPKLFGCPDTAFHCFRVSQRWVFETQRAKPQTPPSSRSGRPWTQVISDGHVSLHQQKPVSLYCVCLFREIQEPQATGFNQDPRSLCGNWGSSTQDLGPLRFPNARRELIPIDRVSAPHVASCKRRLSRRQAHSSTGLLLMWNSELFGQGFFPVFIFSKEGKIIRGSLSGEVIWRDVAK